MLPLTVDFHCPTLFLRFGLALLELIQIQGNSVVRYGGPGQILGVFTRSSFSEPIRVPGKENERILEVAG